MVSSATSTPIMIERFQKLTARSERDSFIAAVSVLDIVVWPFASLAGLIMGLGMASIFGFTWSFSKAMESKGFDDPVYKKNLQRLIDRTRHFEEERHEPRS